MLGISDVKLIVGSNTVSTVKFNVKTEQSATRTIYVQFINGTDTDFINFKGYTEGSSSGSDGKLDPTGGSTRAQMAQVLYNLLGK
jgi:hypothetical protein